MSERIRKIIFETPELFLNEKWLREFAEQKRTCDDDWRDEFKRRKKK